MTIQAGTFVKTGSPHIIEVLGTCGLDFAVVDAEHAPFDRHMLDLMVMAGRAASLPVLIRVPDDKHSTLLSALDIGAAGLLIPHVDSAAQAAEIVRNARFGIGERGYSGSPRFADYGSLGKDEVLKRGDRAILLVQIESVAAVEECEAIASTPGIDGVFIGRGDLSLSMGEVSPSAPAVLAATRRIIAAGVSAEKLIGMFVGSTSEAASFAPLGANWFIVGSDQSILRSGARDIAAFAAQPHKREGNAA
ncbi:MAG: aldolase [Sphingomonadales bacterium]|nr:MAG: aldolase [Sphingomonadales bacterium]